LLASVGSARKRTVLTFGAAAPTYNTVGPRLFTHFAAKLVDFAEVGDAQDVLDVATGTGAVLLEAARRLKARSRLVGVDVTQAMLSRAAAEVERRGLAGVELQLMDAESLRFRDACFDVVFCGFAFSSFPNKAHVIREFARVLRAGGRVGISDAFGWYFDQDPRWSWHREILERFSTLDAPVDPSGARELHHLLTASGLTNVAAKDEFYDLTFTDEEEWWLWSLSHGTRLLFHAIPDSRLDEFRCAAFTQLRDLRAREGAITATMCATLTCANKAG
jgi:SAM-dependent methyltransferase